MQRCHKRTPVPAWAFDLRIPVPVHITTAAYHRADSALALTAAVVSRVPAVFNPPELAALRSELTQLGYLPLPR